MNDDNDYVDYSGKNLLAELITELLKEVFRNINKRFFPKKDYVGIAKAVTAIQLATIQTRQFIDDIGYVRNNDLVKLWLDALKAVVAAKLGDNLPEYIYSKAKFWGEPRAWLNNEESLKLVPKLNDLDQQCEMILQALKLSHNRTI